MASQIDRETTIRQLLLAQQLHLSPDEHPTFQNLPEGAIIGFNKFNTSFLSSVARQVETRNFITLLQFEAVYRILNDPCMAYQFSLGLDLPQLPIDFKWVNFNDWETPKTVQNMPSRQPDTRDAGRTQSPIKIGKRTLDFSESEKSKPWGTLRVVGDELVFEPARYPSTNIKQSGLWSWDSDTRTWHHKGVHAEVVDKLFKVWPEIIVDESVDIALAEARELVELPEDIATHGTLFEFQKDAGQFLLSHPKCLLALAPGLGKSPTSILAAKSLMDNGTIKTVGIIAPKSLLKTWQNEIDKWADSWSCILHPDFKDQPLDADWLIATYDMLSRGTLPEEMETADLIIFDESILISNHSRGKEKDKTTGTSRWVFKTKRVQAAFEIAQQVDWVWLLSGGPTSKFVDDLWSQFHILDPKRFSSYWRFAGDYCIIEQNAWAKAVTGNKPGAIQKIHEHFDDIIFARSQDQVLDLPDWVFESIEVPMSTRQEKTYAEMAVEWTTMVETQGGDIELTAPNTLSQVTRLSQIASNPMLLGQGITAISPKWQAAIELLSFRPGPAIVWTRFIETAKRMEHHLAREGKRVALLIGETPAEIRADIVSAFQDGHLDVLVAHPAVGKFGLTLTAARTTIYLENSYNGDDYYQSLHRVRRIGTLHSPVVITLKSTFQDGRPTIDHLIADVLENKSDTTFKLTAAKLNSYLGR